MSEVTSMSTQSGSGCWWVEVSPCSVRAHRINVHRGCGRPMPVRFLRLPALGLLVRCGSRLVGPPLLRLTDAAVADLLSMRPNTFHEFGTLGPLCRPVI